jgi:hypothetical protein
MELGANGTMSNILTCRSGRKLLAPLLPILLCIAPNSFAQNPAKDNALLHAGDLSLNIEVANQHFGGLHIHDAISSRTIDIPEAFILVLKDKTLLRSADMQVTRISDSIAATTRINLSGYRMRIQALQQTPAGALPPCNFSLVFNGASSCVQGQLMRGSC